MKTLELNQMESIQGEGCGFSIFLLGVATVGLFAMTGPAIGAAYTLAMIAGQGATIVGFVGSATAVALDCK